MNKIGNNLVIFTLCDVCVRLLSVHLQGVRKGGVRMLDDLMTTKELAEYLQLDRMTIYKLLRSGDIPANRVGHQWRFFRSDIDTWIRSKPVQEESQKGS